MSDNFPLKSYLFFNNTVFTDTGIPLPVSDNETVIAYYEDVKFFCKIGNGGLLNNARFKSSSGALYLTNYRIVYKPKEIMSLISENRFDSFHCSLDVIIDIETNYFTFLIENDWITKVFIDIGDSSVNNNVFYSMLKDATKSNVESYDDQQDDIPYYCDVIDRWKR